MSESVPNRINTAIGLTQPRANEPAITVTSPIPTSMASPQAFTQYMDQQHTFTDHLRVVHEQERALWKVERQQMLERIKELEDTVKALGGSVGVPVQSSLNQRKSALHGTAPPLHHRAGNSAVTGNEFWKGAGGQGNTQPARAFSEPSNTSNLSISRNNVLPAIQEATAHAHTTRKKSVGFDIGGSGAFEKDFDVHPVPTIPVYDPESSFDGVNFKPSALAASGSGHRSSETQSPSPLHTPYKVPQGPRDPKPMIINLPDLGLTNSDLLVKDAGHTPLARLNDSAPSTSNQGTPKQAGAELPMELNHVRPPTERADSYFSSGGGTLEPVTTKEDPPLQEPLALTSNSGESGNQDFLSELDSKLRLAQSPDTESEASEFPEQQQQNNNQDSNTTNELKEEDRLGSEEPEPVLRMKRSMNFGSAFGTSTVGKGL